MNTPRKNDLHNFSAPAPTISKLITPEEAADILGVKITTLSVWRCNRRYSLAWVKVGRLVMYKRESVQEFIEARTHGNPDPA